MKGRSFLHTGELSGREIERLLDIAEASRRGEFRGRPLEGRHVALIFFDPSLRTRTSFEVAVRRLGGEVSSLDIGRGVWAMEHRDGAVMDGQAAEHVRDAARYLSRIYDALCVRVFPRMESLEEDLSDPVLRAFAAHAQVPVINMESSIWHPCQALADMLTIRQRFGGPVRVVHAWTTHPKALPMSVSASFVTAARQMGHEVVLAHPPEFPLPEPILRQAPGIRIVHDLREAVRGAQVVYSKSWGSPLFYGRREEEARLRARYSSWRIDAEVMREAAGAIYMHCMPLRRNVEVTDEVVDSPACAIYDQAENRLHVQVALLSEILG